MATWLTSPFESNESGNLVMGSVRKDIDKFKSNPKFKFRIDVCWEYTAALHGMPNDVDSELMEQVEESLNSVFEKDPVASLTEVYTGEGARNLVFYTLSLHIFQKKFNEALEDFPQLPLTFSVEEDNGWEEYTRMLAIAKTDEEDM